MEWKEIDKYLNSHYKNYLVVNQETQDLIEDVLDEYSNIDMALYLLRHEKINLIEELRNY